MSKDYRKELAAAINAMAVFDTHEHHWRAFSREYGSEYDLPYYLCRGYLSGELASAGYQESPGLFDYLTNPELPDGSEAAWEAMLPFLERVRTTSYFRYLIRGLNELFGVTEEDIFTARWRAASQRMRQHSRESKGSGLELCARMHVSVVVLDANVGVAKLAPADGGDGRLLQVARLDMFIHEERGLAKTLEDCAPKDLAHWLSAFDRAFHDSLAAGAVGIKSGLAYNRRIDYSDPDRTDVARIFDRGVLKASPAEKAAYQDFMMNRLCSLCEAADVPLQIHTGIQAGTWHILEDSRPTLLSGLLCRHRSLRVDLFHGGYPWYVHAGLMAKYFPNVYIDGCWLAQISPSAYRAALRSWIETVPGSKILAWGGDHSLLEHSCASLGLARDAIIEVLARLVEGGYFEVRTALGLAKRILQDNGLEFWRL